MINVPRRTAGATDERRDAQEGGGATERERERAKAMAIQQKALQENPSPDNPKLCFFCLIPSETQARRQRKRGQGILYEEERKKKHFPISWFELPEKGMGRLKIFFFKKSTRENAFRSKQT